MATAGDGGAGDVSQNPERESLLKRWVKQRQLDFELEFFPKVLEHMPDYVEVLKAHGHNLTARGLCEEGLEMDRRLALLRPKDPVVHYNLACSYSLLQMRDAALASLESSLKLGYRDFQHMMQDADLEHVRRDARFIVLMKRYWKKARGTRNIC